MLTGKAPKLNAQIRDVLLAELDHGTLRPGARLTEVEVAARFGVSRAPVRQALQTLADQGLLTHEQRRGYLVPHRLGTATIPTTTARALPDVQLNTQPSWAGIYAEVEASIASRLAFGGWQVNESKLAAHFGVSRTVARDVLARLQQSGLIHKDARSRWVANALSPDYVIELYRMRSLLEPAALSDAIRLAPTATVTALRENLEVALAQGADIAPTTLDRLETELHVDLLSFCQDTTLLTAVRACQSVLRAHSFLYSVTPDLFGAEPFIAEHIAVIDFALTGDLHRAEQSLARHLILSGLRSNERIAHVSQSISPKPLSYLSETAPAP